MPNKFIPIDADSANDSPYIVRNGLQLALQLSSLTAAQIVVSFAIQWYTVARLGAGVQTDALAAGSTIPQVMSMLAIETLAFVTVPVLASHPQEELRKHYWPLFAAILVMFGAITLLMLVAVPVVVPLTVPGLSPLGKALAVRLARIQVLGILGNAGSTSLMCMCQARNRFLWPPMAMLMSYLVGFGLLTWKLPAIGVDLAAWVQVLTAFTPVLLLIRVLGPLRRAHCDLSLFKEILRRMRPLVLGAAYYKTSTVADRFLASFLPPGSIILLDLVQRTYGAVERIFNQSIVTPVVPCLSKLASVGNWQEFRCVHQRKLLEVAILNGLITSGTILVWLFWDRIVHGLPLSSIGRLTTGQMTVLVSVFACMSGRMLFSGVTHTLTTAYYAQGDTATPVKISSLTYTLSLGAKIAGFFFAGLNGIALALSFSAFMNVILLSVFLKPGFFWSHDVGRLARGTEPLKVGSPDS